MYARQQLAQRHRSRRGAESREARAGWRRELRGDRARVACEVFARLGGEPWRPHLAAAGRDIFPWLGKRPIAEIKAPELLAVLRRIESRGALETTHRAMQNCGQVFRYAVATGRAERDPTGDLRGALPPPKEKHHASIIEPKRIAELLRAIDAYQGFFATKCALRLAPSGVCPARRIAQGAVAGD